MLNKEIQDFIRNLDKAAAEIEASGFAVVKLQRCSYELKDVYKAVFKMLTAKKEKAIFWNKDKYDFLEDDLSLDVFVVVKEVEGFEDLFDYHLLEATNTARAIFVKHGFTVKQDKDEPKITLVSYKVVSGENRSHDTGQS